MLLKGNGFMGSTKERTCEDLMKNIKKFWKLGSRQVQLKLDTTRYKVLLYSADFDINAVRTWLHDGCLLYYRLGDYSITESAIFGASQENWDTFTWYVCQFTISKCPKFLHAV